MLLPRATTADDLVHHYPSYSSTDIICRHGICISLNYAAPSDESQIFQVISNIIQNESVRSAKQVFSSSAFSPPKARELLSVVLHGLLQKPLAWLCRRIALLIANSLWSDCPYKGYKCLSHKYNECYLGISACV